MRRSWEVTPQRIEPLMNADSHFPDRALNHQVIQRLLNGGDGMFQKLLRVARHFRKPVRLFQNFRQRRARQFRLTL
jgi:hypothetical protein